MLFCLQPRLAKSIDGHLCDLGVDVGAPGARGFDFGEPAFSVAFAFEPAPTALGAVGFQVAHFVASAGRALIGPDVTHPPVDRRGISYPRDGPLCGRR